MSKTVKPCYNVLMEIKILDPVYSLITDKRYIPEISKLLSFEAEFWQKISIKDKYGVPTGKFKKERRTYKKSIVMPSGMFYTGFVPKIEQYLQGKGLQVSVLQQNWPYLTRSPQIPLVLRPDQEKLVSNAVSSRRGIIKSPTGAGKTVIASALITSFKDIKTIFLCHRVSLVHQTVKEFERFGMNVGYLTGTNQKLTGDVIVSTIQTFHKMGQELFDTFDMVIVDEVHRFAKGSTTKKEGGYYFKTLTKLIAPLRYGLTATLPTNEETKLLVEGLIGPLIDEFSLKEGIDQGILAMPKIKIIKIPIDYKVKELRRYADVYDQGIVNNRSRNRMIIKTAKDLATEGKTSLILITKIEHGENLVTTANLLNHKVCFIQGKDDGEIREQVRESLNNKDIKTVIATNIWGEGTNIPSLNCLIIAGGGKSEIALLQSIGRGLRATDEKDSVLIVDFLDISHHYLISHFGERLIVFADNGWL